jgi:hypothetical protein
VRHIYLTVIGVQYWDAMGRDLVAHDNKTSVETGKVVWHNIEDHSEIPAADMACEDDPEKDPNELKKVSPPIPALSTFFLLSSPPPSSFPLNSFLPLLSSLSSPLIFEGRPS